MKKVLSVCFLIIALSGSCLAIDPSHSLLSLVNLSRETVTQDKVTNMFGKPSKVEENKKKIWWHYTDGETNLVICWNKRSALFDNFSFKNDVGKNTVCDGKACSKLKSGTTDIVQAINLLGTPADMKIRNATQELHYTYQNVAMRLFFRNSVLVDFTMLTQLRN